MNNSKLFMEAIPDSSEVDVCVEAQENDEDEDKNEALPAVPTTPDSVKKKIGRPAGRPVGPAIPSNLRNAETGEAFRYGDHNKNENYLSSQLPLAGSILRAAHYIDRDDSEEFTGLVLSFLQQNWDDSRPLHRQTFYTRLQYTKAPDFVQVKAVRAVNKGVIPDGIIKAANRTPHGRKWLSEQQKKITDEQEQEADSAETAAALLTLSEGRASKKAKKNDNYDCNGYEQGKGGI